MAGCHHNLGHDIVFETAERLRSLRVCSAAVQGGGDENVNLRCAIEKSAVGKLCLPLLPDRRSINAPYGSADTSTATGELRPPSHVSPTCGQSQSACSHW